MAPRFVLSPLLLSVLAAAFMASLSHADSPRARFCVAALDRKAMRLSILRAENHFGFPNFGGILGRGVCWWRTRLQRSAHYLAVYFPGRPRPTRAQAKRLIRSLVHRNRVVEIPGYSNFYEFTRDWSLEFESALSHWQLWDGLVKQAWVDGLLGPQTTSARKLRDKMDRLYHLVHERGEMTYVKLQLKGLDSHAYLFVEMDPTDQGYLVHAVDTNEPDQDERLIYYSYGDTELPDIWNGQSSVPFVRYRAELKRFQRLVAKYCGLPQN